MPGPRPKHPTARQRRNKPSTATKLRAPSPKAKAPPLRPTAAKRGAKWHSMTQAWWKDIWKSPMRSAWTDADRHGLYRVAALVDLFWTTENLRARKDLAAEIRMQEARFGLTPTDRWRLGWELPSEDDADDEEGSPAEDRPDPRKVLEFPA